MAGIFTINSDLDPIGRMTKESIALGRKQNELQKTEDREMILDFYEGRGGKKKYLEKYGFENRNIDIPLPFLKLTQNVINRTSLVYKQAPDRMLKSGETNNEAYTEFMANNKQLARGFKTSERYKNALHSVLYRPMWFNGRWNPWVEFEWIPHFHDGDALTPFAYSIPIKRDTTLTDADKIEDRQWYMFWSKDFYYWHDESGNIRFDETYPDGKNPFGMIPFIEKRKEDAITEYWPDGAMDLIKGNQAINMTWCDLIYSQHTQAFSQPYVTGVSEKEAAEMRFAQDSLWTIPEDATVNSVDMNPKITEMLESIKTQIEFQSAAYNLNVKWGQDGNPASGFSLLVQNIDLMESREDDVERAEWEEDQIYDIIQIQDEVLKLGNKLPKRDKKMKLWVDFHEMKFPVNQNEEIERLNFEFDNNISTPVDVIQSKEGLTEEEALQRYNDNKVLNQQLSVREQMLKDEFDKQGAIVVEEPPQEAE